LKIAAICIVLVVFLSGCIFSGTEGSFQFSTPVIRKNGEVFVSTSDRIYSFASGSDSGKTIFSFEPGEGEWFSCAPSVDSDGNLYIGTTKGRLLKISPEGDLKWSFGGNEMEGASAITGSPSFDQSGNVLYGAYDGALYCLSYRRTRALELRYWKRDLVKARSRTRRNDLFRNDGNGRPAKQSLLRAQERRGQIVPAKHRRWNTGEIRSHRKRQPRLSCHEPRGRSVLCSHLERHRRQKQTGFTVDPLFPFRIVADVRARPQSLGQARKLLI